jgi:uncharacterized delta-60 repeat protein
MASAAGIVVLLSACVMPGDIDTSFGTKGVATVDTGDGSRYPHIALTPDGNIVLAAVADYTPNVATLYVTRLRSNGSLDTTFGSSGSTTEPFATPGGSIEDLAVQPDGKILVFEGLEQAATALVRLDANGALDTTFANHGTFSPSSMTAASVGVVPGAHPIIVVGGDTPDGSSVRLEGLNLDGTPDRNFGVNGTFDFQWGGVHSQIGAVEVGPHGRVLVTGDAYAQQSGATIVEPALAALTSTGQFDASFAGGGRVVLQEPDHLIGPRAVFDPSGRILVTWNKIVERLLANGSVDRSYGTNGFAQLPTPPPLLAIDSASLLRSDSTGRAILISSAVDMSMRCHEACPAIATVGRLTSSGATDSTFAHGTGMAVFSAYTHIDDAVVDPAGLLAVPDPSNISVIRIGL